MFVSLHPPQGPRQPRKRRHTGLHPKDTPISATGVTHRRAKAIMHIVTASLRGGEATASRNAREKRLFSLWGLGSCEELGDSKLSLAGWVVSKSVLHPHPIPSVGPNTLDFIPPLSSSALSLLHTSHPALAQLLRHLSCSPFTRPLSLGIHFCSFLFSYCLDLRLLFAPQLEWSEVNFRIPPLFFKGP